MYRDLETELLGPRSPVVGDVALKEPGLERSAYGWATNAARLHPEAVSDGPPTSPYELSDLLKLLGRDTIEDDEVA